MLTFAEKSFLQSYVLTDDEKEHLSLYKAAHLKGYATLTDQGIKAKITKLTLRADSQPYMLTERAKAGIKTADSRLAAAQAVSRVSEREAQLKITALTYLNESIELEMQRLRANAKRSPAAMAKLVDAAAKFKPAQDRETFLTPEQRKAAIQSLKDQIKAEGPASVDPPPTPSPEPQPETREDEQLTIDPKFGTA